MTDGQRQSPIIMLGSGITINAGGTLSSPIALFDDSSDPDDPNYVEQPRQRTTAAQKLATWKEYADSGNLVLTDTAGAGLSLRDVQSVASFTVPTFTLTLAAKKAFSGSAQITIPACVTVTGGDLPGGVDQLTINGNLSLSETSFTGITDADKVAGTGSLDLPADLSAAKPVFLSAPFLQALL